MAIIIIHDRADEFRFEINGHFSGRCVDDVAGRWKSELPGSYSRKFTVDISNLTGLDGDGRRLLRQMYRHGTQFACATVNGLAFLDEISKPSKAGNLTVLESEPGTPGIHVRARKFPEKKGQAH